MDSFKLITIEFLGPQFKKYNYGWIGNLKHYGELIPPAYNLSKTTVPVYVFYGANDYAATPQVVCYIDFKMRFGLFY